MRILLLDIETAPNKGYFWRVYKENIGIDQIIDSGYVMSWSARWFGEKEIMFDAFWVSGHKKMLKRMHKLLDQADVVVHFNGESFDVPTLNKEFLRFKMTPPSPYKQVDLYKVASSTFRFTSNKLDYIARYLDEGEKVRHRGFELWVKCMGEDRRYSMKEIRASRKIMERYNKRDVIILERVYLRMRPWVKNHPNWGAYEDGLRCPSCGGTHFHRKSTAVVKHLRYPRFQCQKAGCGRWFRSNKPLNNGHRERFHGI